MTNEAWQNLRLLIASQPDVSSVLDVLSDFDEYVDFDETGNTDFVEGDKVMIRRFTRYHKPDEPYNPIDTIGIVTECDGELELPLTVKWDNGNENCYTKHDLVKVVS